MTIRLPTMQELFTGELIENGEWVVANVDTQIPWPTKLVKISFRDRNIFLLPPTSTVAPTGGHQSTFETYPCVAIKLNTTERFDDGLRIISHYLSSLAWVERRGVMVEHWTGGNLPRPMGGRPKHPTYTQEFYRPYLPDTLDQNTRLALAFYREGLGLNHVAYQCLSFFKVLNIFLRTGPTQKQWINDNIAKITDHRANTRISLIRTQRQNVGDYLYSSGRCAIAHAGVAPTADPEDPTDIRRLGEDLPVVQALAEVAIEYQFRIKSAQTVYREHLYELEGFREIFGAEKVVAIKEHGSLAQAEWPALPRLSARLAFQEPYGPLENMAAQIIDVQHGTATVRCEADNRLSVMIIKLNFAQERLQVDVLNEVISLDDGSSLAAQAAARVSQFQLDHFRNGILEIWNSVINKPLGRCDAFLPCNVDMAGSVANFEATIRAINAEANRRRATEASEFPGSN